MQGYIKLHRKIIEWEWYDDMNTKCLFLHILFKANHKDKKWRGNIIKRGSFITSLENLSKEVGLTVRQVRTSLDKLILTNEIDKRTTSLNTCIIVNNYNEYQVNDKPMANERQTNDKPMTTTKNDNNEKNDKEKKEGDFFGPEFPIATQADIFLPSSFSAISLFSSSLSTPTSQST